MSHTVKPLGDESNWFRCQDCGQTALYGYFSISCLGPQPTPEPHLAAAYGEIPTPRFDAAMAAIFDNLAADLAAMTPQSPLTPFGEALQSLSHGLAEAVTSHENDSEAVEKLAAYINIRGQHWFGADHLCVKCVQVYGRSENVCPGAPLLKPAAIREALIELGRCRVEPDYDAILLAARKRREALNDITTRPLFSRREAMRREEEARLQPLASAMSRPLTFSPLLGWKGKPIDE